jgi:hypothetical protein
MSRFRTALAGLVALAALSAMPAACSTTDKLRASDDPITTKEQQQAATLKPRYKDVIMGTDVKGETLVLYVDVNNLDSMDEPAEDAMKADALAQWKKIWLSNHPGKHAKVTVVLRDYFGNEVFTENTRT